MTLKTAHKILIARMLLGLVMFARRILGLSYLVTTRRSGICWNLDLREGIDLSIYVLGSFEPATQKLYRQLIKAGDVVLDIGANIGSHTLPLAKLVGKAGKVIAFEPTKYAVEKLQKNIALNAEIAGSIDVKQLLLVKDSHQSLPECIYSSWPLLPQGEGLHAVHKGQLKGTDGARAATLDQSLRESGISRVDFIKLDVDGNEYTVLAGGEETIAQFRPTILMEFAPYLFADNIEVLDGIMAILNKYEYAIYDEKSLNELPSSMREIEKLIPQGGSLNIIAMVKNQDVYLSD